MNLHATDPAYFPTDLVRAIGLDAVLRTDPVGIAVARYIARATSTGMVLRATRPPTSSPPGSPLQQPVPLQP